MTKAQHAEPKNKDIFITIIAPMKINKISGIPLKSCAWVFFQWSQIYYLCSLYRFILMFQRWPYQHSVHTVRRKHGLWDCPNTQILTCGKWTPNSVTCRPILLDNEVSPVGSPRVDTGYLSLCTDMPQTITTRCFEILPDPNLHDPTWGWTTLESCLGLGTISAADPPRPTTMQIEPHAPQISAYED